eukprot:1183473-Prorocentrum_minimum.AAC.1
MFYFAIYRGSHRGPPGRVGIAKSNIRFYNPKLDSRIEIGHGRKKRKEATVGNRLPWSPS